MRYLVLLGDGMADFPLDELGGQTPLEAAPTPAMDDLARSGMSGLFCPIPDNLPPGSDIGNLALFGYNPNKTFTGPRAVGSREPGHRTEGRRRSRSAAISYRSPTGR